ncbi:MAG: HPP family protein, partial [Pelagibacteraceae bacterium]|nr:HPP family protein [Pelagibacteraceae bacterium]
MNAKKIIFWPPLLAGIGTGLIIGILAYITYESILSGTAYGLWFMASFGSTVINVFGFPKNRNSQPKNVLFGHLLSALVGIIFIT